MLKIDHWAAKSFELFFILLLVAFLAFFPSLGRKLGFLLLKPVDLLFRAKESVLGASVPGPAPEEVSRLRKKIQRFLEEQRKKAIPPIEKPDYFRVAVALKWKAGRLWIDKGWKDGVAEGDPYLYGATLLGLVSRVEEERSEVCPLWDERFRISACIWNREKEESFSFLLEGTGDGELCLKYPLGAAAPRRGDLVVTMGYEEKIPKGLRLGTIRWKEEEDRFTVKPFLSPRAKGFGAVLLSKKGRLLPKDRKGEKWRELPAKVLVAGDGDPFRSSLLLSLGKEKGVYAGCPVVADGCLVGVISSAALGMSRVTLLGDPGLSLPLLSFEEEEDGVFRGLGRKGRCLVLRREKESGQGAAGKGRDSFVLFTGFGHHPVPPGLLVGKARKEGTVLVEPFQDPSRLEEAAVLVPVY